MALYSFSLEKLSVASCRSKAGFDDLWLIINLMGADAGPQSPGNPVGLGVQAGQEFTGPWSAGPFELADGQSCVAVYTLVNLRGSAPESQDRLITGLQADLADALARVAVKGAEEASVRGVFGPAGEFLRAPGADAGAADCQGLVGVFVAPFQGLNAPDGDEVQTTDSVALSASTPATCGTEPRSRAVFSVRVGPSLFDPRTTVTLLPTDISSMEVFAVGLDGRVRYKVRDTSGSFTNWSVLGSQNFSPSVPLVAIRDTIGTKRLFGGGANGVIYQATRENGGAWQDWEALTAIGQFAPGTPLAAVPADGGTSLWAVDANGITQGVALAGEMATRGVNGATFAPGTMLLALSRARGLTNLLAVDDAGHTYEASQVSLSTGFASASAWSDWRPVGGERVGAAGRRWLSGTTYNLRAGGSGPIVGAGLAACQVDDEGNILSMVASASGEWNGWQMVPGLKTLPGGWVCTVSTDDDLRLFSLDPDTGAIRQTINSTPANPGSWGPWTSVPFGPAIRQTTALSAVCTGDAHIELFAVDVHGQVRRLGWRPATGWGKWAVI